MGKQLLDLGRRRLERLLDGATGLELAATGDAELAAATGRTDAVWVLRSGPDEWRFLVEVKSALWPRGVDDLTARVKKLAVEVEADRCLVIVPRVTERTGEFLERNGIDYIDLRGNIRITVPGRIHVVASGGQAGTAYDLPVPKDRIANPFAGKASRIVRALLAEPCRWWGVTELADRVEVSAGMSVKTLRALEADLYVRRDSRRRVRVAAGESLLRRWAAVSGPAFREATRFASPIPDPDELAIRLSERLGEMGVGYALSRLAAARFVEPYAPARVVDIYVDRKPGELEAALDLFPVDRGESVRLVGPSDPGVLQFTEDRGGVTVVNPAQLFVDLSNGRGREVDVAEQLLENQLRGAWSVEEGA